jgi:hypothetical protein
MGTVWIVVIVVVVAVVLLAAVLSSLAGRLRPLQRAVRRLNLRAEQAEGLRTRALGLQQQAENLRDVMEKTAAAAARRREG